MKAIVSQIIYVGSLLILSCIQIEGQEIDASDSIAHPVRFDNYGDLSFKEERSRLDLVAFTLKEKSSRIVYFDIYAGRRSCMGEAQARGIRAKNYLVSNHGIAPDRIIWRDGGYQDDFTVDVWIQPRGVQAMQVMPTVKRGGAQIIKDCVKKYRRQRGKSSGAHNRRLQRTGISVPLIDNLPLA